MGWWMDGCMADPHSCDNKAITAQLGSIWLAWAELCNNEKGIQLESKIKDMHLKYREKEQTVSKINKKSNFLRGKVTILFDKICKP